MLSNQVLMLRNIFIVEVSDPEIQQYVEQERKVEECIVKAVHFSAYGNLHVTVYAQYPKGFYEQIKPYDQYKISNESSLHMREAGQS